MRESIFFCLLSIVHSSVVDMGGDCERMYIKEKCDSIGCSGYAGHEPNDRRLSWESCNATVKNQMVEMFPSFYLRVTKLALVVSQLTKNVKVSAESER